jgi:alpha,alpha-trehalose phosphorylase
LEKEGFLASSGKKYGLAPTIQDDPWLLAEHGFSSDSNGVAESLFAQGNGYVGIRGTYEEPLSKGSSIIEGTYLNGAYVREEIHYDEGAYGFASHNNKLVCVPGGTDFHIHVGDDQKKLLADELEGMTRSLDMRTGALVRKGKWQFREAELQLCTRRFVSLSMPNIVALQYELVSEGFEGPVAILTGLNTAYGNGTDADDPRAGSVAISDCLDAPEIHVEKSHFVLHQRIKGRDAMVVSGCKNKVSHQGANLPGKQVDQSGLWADVFDLALKPGDRVMVTKYMFYGDCDIAGVTELDSKAAQTLKDADELGFDALLAEQERLYAKFWNSADITISGPAYAQQSIRFNLFHLFQSAGRDGKRSLAAKGLTGPGYDGHYFWDTEIYAVPFFVFTCPEIARSLIEYRISTLDAARDRARIMGHDTGALYPWRTIGGEECSSYFPAGSAQYHINAAIAYALVQYLEVTEDFSLLNQGGAEMLFETARIWMNLGHHSERLGGKFSIHEVTGPDEYSAMVDNNLYTNVMAQHHLASAVKVSALLKKRDPAFHSKALEKLNLTMGEIEAWQHASDQMYVPYDDQLGIHEQHDGFLEKPEWDFEGMQADKYPLLLNFHPLVIYRHQVLKQADVVLAQILLADKFSKAEKKRNLAYYEARTTHDSTLSACVYSVANAEAGNRDKAYRFFEETFRMDLENRHANTHYGVHIACMAGSWMSVVYGFAGMRHLAGKLCFDPYLPDGWNQYGFAVRHKKNVVDVSVSQDGVTYMLRSGSSCELTHKGALVKLSKAPVFFPE